MSFFKEFKCCSELSQEKIGIEFYTIPWNHPRVPDSQMQISGKLIVEIPLQLLHFLPGKLLFLFVKWTFFRGNLDLSKPWITDELKILSIKQIKKKFNLCIWILGWNWLGFSYLLSKRFLKWFHNLFSPIFLTNFEVICWFVYSYVWTVNVNNNIHFCQKIS